MIEKIESAFAVALIIIMLLIAFKVDANAEENVYEMAKRQVMNQLYENAKASKSDVRIILGTERWLSDEEYIYCNLQFYIISGKAKRRMLLEYKIHIETRASISKITDMDNRPKIKLEAKIE